MLVWMFHTLKSVLTSFRYLHQNVIFKMENLDSLVNLDTLNLSQNQITKVCIQLARYSRFSSDRCFRLRGFQTYPTWRTYSWSAIAFSHLPNLNRSLPAPHLCTPFLSSLLIHIISYVLTVVFSQFVGSIEQPHWWRNNPRGFEANAQSGCSAATGQSCC